MEVTPTQVQHVRSSVRASIHMINFGKHVSTVLVAAALCGSSALAQVVISDFGVVNPLAISLGDFTWTGDIASSGIAQFVGIATGTALQSGGAAARKSAALCGDSRRAFAEHISGIGGP